ATEVGVCPGFIRSRSRSGRTSKSARAESSRSRCCAVAQTIVSNPGSARSRSTTGAILMASGRVPTTTRTFRIGSGNRFGDRGSDFGHFGPGELGPDRKREHLGGRPLGNGQVARLAAEVPETFLQMERHRVVDLAS